MKSKYGKRFRQHLYTVFFRFTFPFAGCRVYNDKATHVPKTTPGIEQIQCWINQSTRIEVLKVRTSARNIRWRTLHEPVHWHILTTKSNSHRISCISTSWPGCMVHIMFLNMYRPEWYLRQTEHFAFVIREIRLWTIFKKLNFMVSKYRVFKNFSRTNIRTIFYSMARLCCFHWNKLNVSHKLEYVS